MSVNAVTVDENGISIKSFNEIRASLADDYKAVFPDLSTDPSTPDGMLIDLVAYAIMEVAQGIQSIYSNLDVSTAVGTQLSNIAVIAGFPRTLGEDDDSLRLRIISGSRTGFATYSNMLSYLRTKINSSVNMTVNDEDKSVGGIDPHSFVVYMPENFTPPSSWTGTVNDYLAQQIWDCKAAGIKPSGNMSGTAKDSCNYPHDVRFSIGHDVSYSLKVMIKTYSEEVLPADYADSIKKSIVAWSAKNLTSGKDIIPQRLYTPVFAAVDGIEDVHILVKATSSSTWIDDVVRIDADVRAVFSESNITVEMG